MNFKPQLSAVPNSSPKPNEVSRPSSSPSVLPSAPVNAETRHPAEDEEEEEEEDDDDFVQLARRLFLTIPHLIILIISLLFQTFIILPPSGKYYLFLCSLKAHFCIIHIRLLNIAENIKYK